MPGATSQNLVISDLFFGLGAVLLIVIAVVSLSVQNMLSGLIATSDPDFKDTEAAVQTLARDSGPVLFARSGGLQWVTTDGAEMIGVNDFSTEPRLQRWLGDATMLIIDADGQVAAFLTLASAARSGVTALNTLRLAMPCRALRPTDAGQIACAR